MNYYQEDHAHCWEQDNPPCGQKIKHFKCCLCEMNHPEITEARQAGIDEAVGLLQTLKKEIPKTSRKPFELAENVGKQMVLDEAIKALQDNK